MIASQTSAVRTIAPPLIVVPPIVAAISAIYDIAQLGERLDVPVGSVGYGDGPTQLQCNKSLQFKWPSNSDTPVTPYGSWIDANGATRGSTAFASATIPSSGALPLSITWDITTLMRKLAVSNTGVYITPETAGIGAGGAFASMQWDGDPTMKPKFHIVTSAGTFDVGAKVDSQIVASSGDHGMDTFMRDPYCIKPDLSTVQGVVTSATLTLWDTGGSQLRPCRYDCYYLDMPALVWDPVRQLGTGVQQGIAASVATNDKDLAGHPSVIFYPSFDSQAASQASGWTNQNFAAPGRTYEFVSWPDYGLNALRVGSTYQAITPSGDGSTIISWRRALGTSPLYTDLYVRYLMKIDPDVYIGMSEAGVKLPGFESIDNGHDTISYRMEHDKQSAENRGAYSWWIHAYDADNRVDAGFADNRPTSQCALTEGHIHCVEQHLKLNTKTGSTFNADGVLQIWLDGILVSNDTTRRMRTSDVIDHIDNFFANFFHGGGGTPSSRIHYEFGGVCIATQYIGPPKIVNHPSWRPPAGYFADIPSSNVPNDVFYPALGSGGWVPPLSFWTGGAFIRDYSELGAFVCHGGGHSSTANTQGTLTFDFSASPSAGKWEYHNAPLQLNYETGLNQAGEFSDGSFFAQHTYLGVHEMPASWGGGPKGSLVVFAHNAGTVAGGVNPTSHKIDLSQALMGYSRLCEGFSGGTYPITEMDEGRQGWWVSNAGGGPVGNQVRFISKYGTAGAVTAANTFFYGGGALVLWPSKNVLVQIPEGAHSGSNTSQLDKLHIYDIATDTEQTVSTVGKPIANRENTAGVGQEIDTVTPVSGGTGYVTGDTITFNTNNATYPQNYPKVTVTAAGGVVTGVSFFNFPHSGYTMPQRGWLDYPPPSNPISQFSTSGIGIGATFNATWRTPKDTFQPWFSGACWCESLRCIVAFDPYAVEIVTLTPPAGDIYGSSWTYARVSISHWTAGNPSGQATLNPGQNGPYSKFRFIPTLKAFVVFSICGALDNNYHPPQIINLPGLG